MEWPRVYASLASSPRQHLHALEKEILDPLRLLLHPSLEVLLVVAVLEHERALLQDSRDARLELAHRDRLEEKVGRALVEAIHGGHRLAHAGEHDDRRVGIAPLQLLEELDAVEIGHAEIGDDERRLADAIEHGERLAAGRGLEAHEPLCAEHPDKRASNAGLVVYDETVGGAGHEGLRGLDF